MTNRRMLMLMVGATVPLAAASLILGLAAGHRILVSTGFAGFASELDSIPGSSGIVGLALTPLMFAIGVGLTWKGASESRMRSVTRGTLEGSTIRVVPRDPEDGYRIYSRVSYYVDGVRYETEGPHEDILSSGAEARRRLGDLHPGGSIQVFYKPGDPGTVNLDAPPGRTALVWLLGLVITMGGLWAAFIGVVVLSG